MKSRSLLLGIGSFILGVYLTMSVLAYIAQAGGVWYVSPDGNNGNSCLAPENACQTIGAAMGKASSGDTIVVAVGTYSESLTLSKDLTLQGAGASMTVVDGNGSNRVFTVTAGSVVTITDMAVTSGFAPEGGGILNEGILSLNNCNISGNKAVGADGVSGTRGSAGAAGLGGGIYNEGILVLDNCTLNDNQAVGGDGGDSDNGYGYGGGGGDGMGGGIYSQGTVKLKNCTIHSNVAAGGRGGDSDYEAGGGGDGRGGGIYSNALLTLHDCSVDNGIAVGGESGTSTYQPSANNGYGRGGGIDGGGTIFVERTHIISNTADSGGGLYTNPYFSGGSVVTLTGSTISSNSVTGSGGGVRDSCSNTLDCSLTVIRSTISNNSAASGGGIYTSGASGTVSLVTLDSSTISGNYALNRGGGIGSGNQIGGTKTMTLTNSTVSGNVTDGNGGGIAVVTTGQSTNTVKLINASVIDNVAAGGSGFHTVAGGSGLSRVLLGNTIVANTPSDQNCMNEYGGSVVSDGNNLESGSSCNLNAASDLSNTPAHVGPLQNNDGPTLTHALLPVSPAVDAGSNLECPVADQRGATRPTDGDGDGVPVCDMGAYESQPASLTLTTQTTPSSIQTGGPLTYTLAVTNTGADDLTAVITDVLPSGVTPNGVVTWTASITAPGGVWLQTVPVTVNAGHQGALTNVVLVTIEEGATGVYTHTLAPSLENGEQVAATVQTGQPLTYTLWVTNTGNFVLHATITQTLSGNVIPAGPMVWTPVTIAPDDGWTQTAVVTVEEEYVGLIVSVMNVDTAEGATGVSTATATSVDIPVSGLNATNDSPTLLGKTTTLSAAAEIGSNVMYDWAFGDGEAGSGAVVTHTYPTVGVYTAEVTASNSVSVLTATTTITITDENFLVYLPVVLGTSGATSTRRDFPHPDMAFPEGTFQFNRDRELRQVPLDDFDR